MKLYFDKKSNLLVMTKRDSVNPGTEEAVVETSMLSDYKMVDGLLMTAMKTTVKTRRQRFHDHDHEERQKHGKSRR